MSNMANSLNEVNLIGNLTADPEIRETPNGHKVATFSVATSKKWKDAGGEMKEESEFHNIVAWRGLAEIAEQYMQKGKKVYVKGELKTRSYDKEVGGTTVKMYRTEIVANSVILLGSPAANKEQKSDLAKAADETFGEDTISIEDIPF